MRAHLLDLVRPGLARQRRQLMLVLERSVRRDGQDGNTAARIIGHHEEFARWVDGLTNAVLAAGRRAIEELGLAGYGIERKRGRIVLVAVHRIEKTLVMTQGEVGRIDQIADVLDVSPRPGRRIGTIDMNAVTTRLAL